MLKVFNMYSITLNGNSSELSCDFFPPIDVGKNARVCLLGLQTNNSIPNVNEDCNRMCFVHADNGSAHPDLTLNAVITIPTGSYELNELECAIKQLLPAYVTSFELKANNNTLKCEMKCNIVVDFSIPNSIAPMLGFQNRIYEANVKHQSEALVNICKINCIYIESNLISGSFNNGRQCHAIHEFYPNVPPGYKIIEIPRHLVLYPLNCSEISRVCLTLKDQNGDLIDLRGEPISIRLLIRD